MPTLQEFAIKWELSEDCGKCLAVPDGWLPHVDKMFRDLALVRGWDPKYVTTLKNKLGSLRVYYGAIPHTAGSDALHSVVGIIVEAYVQEAQHICEKCGSQDGVSTSADRRGWIRTVCIEHKGWTL